MAKRVAAIFAHPDDEVLGAGASLAAHAQQGDDVRILILATGLAARGEDRELDIKQLRDQARQASETLGARSTTFADFPDNAMDTVPLLTVTQTIERFLADFPADVIYTHHEGDLNIDHGITHRAVMTAARPLPGSPDREILAAEVNSATEYGPVGDLAFRPTVYVDIEETLERKLAALACYAGELRPPPHPRSLEGVRIIAAWRGMQVGRAACEAFQLVRSLRPAP